MHTVKTAAILELDIFVRCDIFNMTFHFCGCYQHLARYFQFIMCMYVVYYVSILSTCTQHWDHTCVTDLNESLFFTATFVALFFIYKTYNCSREKNQHFGICCSNCFVAVRSTEVEGFES